MDAELGSKLADLVTCAMNEDNANAKGAEDSEVEEDVREIFAAGDFAINGDDEDFFAEARDVLENFAKVGNVHSDSLWERWGRKTI